MCMTHRGVMGLIARVARTVSIGLTPVMSFVAEAMFRLASCHHRHSMRYALPTQTPLGGILYADLLRLLVAG